MWFSDFTAWFVANRTAMPKAIANEIKREAIQRVIDRATAGYADSYLDFSDLIKRGETAIAPK